LVIVQVSEALWHIVILSFISYKQDFLKLTKGPI